MNIKTNAFLDRTLEIIKAGWNSGDKKAGIDQAADFISNIFIAAHPDWRDSGDYEDWDCETDGLRKWLDALDTRSRMKKWLVPDPDSPDSGEYISMFYYDDEVEYNDLWSKAEEAIQNKLDGNMLPAVFVLPGIVKPPKKIGIIKTILLLPFLIIRWLLRFAVCLCIALIIIWFISLFIN